MKNLANSSRIVAGVVFIFSGFVKGVDPLGFSYKLEDYFLAFHWPVFVPFDLFFSILLCTLEFSIGVMLLLNLKMKITSWLLLLIMSFFTLLTLNDAINNPVPDCGCFGDALKLTNWQTFYKNIFLIILALAVFIYRKRYKPFVLDRMQWIIIGVFAILFAGFSYYGYAHLPVIDFTEWKKGHKLYTENPQPIRFYVTYRNLKSGENKEYLSPDYPYTDSLWMKNWVFVSQRAEDPNVYYGKSLVITDSSGTDRTAEIIRNPGYQLIVNSPDLKKTNIEAFVKIAQLCKRAQDFQIQTAVLVSASQEEINRFKIENKLELDFYNADDILLKTMVRSNPGLMLLKSGVVIDKWHYHDIPDLEIIKTMTKP